MISYQLAKELKEYGFPQELKKGYSTTGSYPITTPVGIARQTESVYVPTLEELIEACGDKFYGISVWRDGVGNKGYYVEYPKTWEKRDERVEGSTPIEAVASLWLALNKNKNG